MLFLITLKTKAKWSMHTPPKRLSIWKSSSIMNGSSEPLTWQTCFHRAKITVKERDQFSVFCERRRCDAAFLVQPLKGPGDTGGIEGRICGLARWSMVCTGTSERNTGTFSDARGIYRYIQMQMCNTICKCVESVVMQQKNRARYPCFPNPWSSSPGFSCWTYWPTFQWQSHIRPK